MPLSNAEKSKRYRERHPDRFRESLKKYWDKKYKCGCGKTLTQKNKASHLRTEEHKRFAEFMNMKRKLDYMENKEEYAEKAKEPIICECGAKVTYSHLARHKTTQKHIKIIEDNEIKQMNQDLADMFSSSDTQTDSEEDGKYDNNGLLITTDSDTE